MKKILLAVSVLLAMPCLPKVQAHPLYAVARNVDDNTLAAAKALEDKGDFKAALSAYQAQEAEVLSGKVTDRAVVAQLYHNMGRVYNNLQDVPNGRAYTRKALDIRKELYGEVNESYITSLNNYALTYSFENNYQEALSIQKQVLELCNRLDHQHPAYGLFLINAGRFYYITQDYVHAAEVWEKALPLVEKFSPQYEFLLNYLADIYMNLNDTANQERILNLATEHNEHELTLPCDEPTCMVQRAEYYYQRGDNAKAKDCYTKVMAMPLTDEQKIDVYESYARFQSAQKSYATAADYYIMASSAAQKCGKANYPTLLYLAALCSHTSSKYDQAIELYKKAIDAFTESKASGAGEKVAQCNQGIGNALRALSRSKEAVDYHKKTVAYYRDNKPGGEEYPKAIASLATSERYAEEYDAAIEHFREAMALYKELGLDDKYQETQHSLVRCCAAAGKPLPEVEDSKEAEQARLAKLDNIIKEETEALQITGDYLGKLSKASSLGVIAGCYALKPDYENSVSYFEQYIDTLRGAIRNEFRLQSETERMYAWSQQTTNMEQLFEVTAGLEKTSASTLMARYGTTLYNAALLSKGILLNSSIEFEKLLSSTYKNKPELKQLYDNIKNTEEKLNTLRETATTDADLDSILTLMRENDKQQLQLSRSCAEIADYTRYMGYTWQNVQAALSKKDVAIEFVQTGDKVLDDYKIYAVVLTRETPSPVIVALPGVEALAGTSTPNELYASATFGSLVWGPLASYIDKKENIYFSPAGDFNNIAIEYLPYGGAPLSERKQVYRLSSTKALCYSSNTSRAGAAVLFGNIDYDESDGLTASTARKVETLAQERGADGFASLDNTLREIQQIEQTLKQSNVANVQVFTKTEAAEQTFKALSGRDIDILHIATHGAYKKETSTHDDKVQEDNAMQNSFLAFAGINNELPDAEADGKVTAGDIAKMDLRNCRLAVLSACETGLGHLGTDGVFGLQRGFKNAGVQTIVMSLWSVNDKATYEMMTQFYRALYAAKGVTPNEALRTAQKYLRTHGYEAPEYWAAFIVLDGNKE